MGLGVKVLLAHFVFYGLVVAYICVGAAIIKRVERDEGNELTKSFHSSFLLVFEIVTTIGYGHRSPTTHSGRFFCFFFAITGIPIWLLALTDMGKYLSMVLLALYNRVYKSICEKRGWHYGRGRDVLPVWFVGVVLLFHILFAGAIAVGQKGQDLSYAEKLYLTFVTVTTVGFGDFYPDPTRPLQMYVTLVYFSIGLIVATLFIDRFAETLRKFHHFGVTLRDAGKQVIWVGSHKTTLETFSKGVLQSAGITENRMNFVLGNMEEIVEVASESQKMQDKGNEKQNAKVVAHLPKPDAGSAAFGIDIESQTDFEETPPKIDTTEVEILAVPDLNDFETQTLTEPVLTPETRDVASEAVPTISHQMILAVVEHVDETTQTKAKKQFTPNGSEEPSHPVRKEKPLVQKFLDAAQIKELA